MLSKPIDKRYIFAAFQIIGPFISIWALYQYATLPLVITALIMFFLFKCIGHVITYHRILCHSTHKMHPVVEFICTGLGFYGGLISPVGWCAMHVNHHKYADTWKDPHPPTLLGWKALFAIFWNDSGPTSGDKRTVLRLKRNPIANFYDVYYWPLLALPFTLLLISPQIFFFVFFIPMIMSLWSLHMTVYGHDESGPKYKGLIYGILSMGEHHHKWHHDHPNDTSGEGWLHNLIELIATRNKKVI